MPRPSNREKVDRHIDAALDAFDAGNTKQALREIDEAIELTHGDDAAPWAVKSRVLYDLGEHDEAEAAARNSIRIDVTNYHAWISLGLIFFDRHQFEKAAFCYKKAIEEEEDYGTYTMLAEAERQFDPESAIKYAKRALELNPDWDEAETILKTAMEDVRKK